MRVLAVLVLIACTVCFGADKAVAQDERAMRVLDAAIAKLGGAGSIRSLDSIYYSAKGTENGSALGQDYSAVKELVNPHEERLAVFLDGVRLSYEYKTDRGDGTTRWRRFMFTDTRRIVADFVNKAAYASTVRHPSVDRNQDARRIPHTLLLEVLANSPSLSYAGGRTFANRPHEVIALTLPNTKTPVSLYFDAETNLLSKYEFSTDFPGLGAATVEYIFSDHRPRPKLLWAPAVHQIRINGKIWRDLAIETFAADADASRSMMELPPELEGFVELPGTVKQIAKGVYFVYNVGGFQPMFVEFKDFVLAIEAPASHPSLDETPLETVGNINAVSDEFIAKIRQTIPDKPIRYVAVTHAHSDHMGGLRAFLPEKSIVLTTPGDRIFYERFVPQLKIETVEATRTITDGERVVELISVGPNPHTGENLVVYFPREKFLFQGDLFYFNGDPSFPPRDRMTVMPFFAKWLKAKELSPARIYGFHSTLFGTMEHVDKIITLSKDK